MRFFCGRPPTDEFLNGRYTKAILKRHFQFLCMLLFFTPITRKTIFVTPLHQIAILKSNKRVFYFCEFGAC